MEDLFRKGVQEFNTRCFFEAHDTWEELWRETSGSNRLFYQGLIQTAVALYHFGNGNFRGSCSQFGKALTKLEQYVPAHLGMNTQRLAVEVRTWQRCAEERKEGLGKLPEPAEYPRIMPV